MSLEKQFNLSLISICVAAGLVGCGDSAAPTASSASAPVSSGVITGFGSVYVDGVRYRTDGTSFSLDEAAGTESELEVGMVVEVEGEVDPTTGEGNATTIRFEDEVEGPISTITLDADSMGTLEVLGQSIEITAETVFDSEVQTIADWLGVLVGNIVEVSGYSAGDGTIVATRVELVAESIADVGDIQVKGLVTSLDTAGMKFNLGTMSIDYSAANLVKIPEQGLSDGLFVKVVSESAPVGGVLSASVVKLKGDERGGRGREEEEGREGKFGGVITAALVGDSFAVNGREVLIDRQTEFEDGAVVSDLVEGTVVKVEGEFNADGALVAEEVKLRPKATYKIEGPVAVAGEGSVTIGELSFQVPTNAIKVDRRSEHTAQRRRYFMANDMAAGDWAKINFYVSAAGERVATKLRSEEAGDSSTAVEIEGKLDALEGSIATVGGIDIAVDGLGAVDWVVGDRYEFNGEFSGPQLIATEYELDD